MLSTLAVVFSYSNTTTGRPSDYGMGLAFVSSAKTGHITVNNWITQLAFSTSNIMRWHYNTRTLPMIMGWMDSHLECRRNFWYNSGLDADLLDGQQGSGLYLIP